MNEQQNPSGSRGVRVRLSFALALLDLQVDGGIERVDAWVVVTQTLAVVLLILLVQFADCSSMYGVGC